MTEIETAQALNDLAKLIAENTPDMTQTAALSAKAKIQKRIQETGETANEVELRVYSKEYKKFKVKSGKDVGFTNLTFSGEMWRKTGITSTGQGDKGYEVIIGGLDVETEKKIEGNSFSPSFRGDILRVSKKEEQELQEGIDDYLNKLVKQAGL